MANVYGVIILIKTSTGWCAKFTGEAAAEIRSAFHTDTIPTAFTAEAEPTTVQKAIKAGWPKCVVLLEEGL